MTTNALKIGQRLFCNGYPGIVTQIHVGQLEGMATVKFENGSVCVDIHELLKFKNVSIRYIPECKWCKQLGAPEWSEHAKVWIHRRPTIDKKCLNPTGKLVLVASR